MHLIFAIKTSFKNKNKTSLQKLVRVVWVKRATKAPPPPRRRFASWWCMSYLQLLPPPSTKTNMGTRKTL